MSNKDRILSIYDDIKDGLDSISLEIAEERIKDEYHYGENILIQYILECNEHITDFLEIGEGHHDGIPSLFDKRRLELSSENQVEMYENERMRLTGTRFQKTKTLIRYKDKLLHIKDKLQNDEYIWDALRECLVDTKINIPVFISERIPSIYKSFIDEYKSMRACFSLFRNVHGLCTSLRESFIKNKIYAHSNVRNTHNVDTFLEFFDELINIITVSGTNVLSEQTSLSTIIHLLHEYDTFQEEMVNMLSEIFD